MRVAIIDYGLCNVDSVFRAVEECGGNPIITYNEKDIKQATHIVLPGVGVYSNAMQNMHKHHLDEILKEQVIMRKIPFLGICLGMQLIASKGYEVGETKGLGWIEGEVVRFKSGKSRERVPHVGWNEVRHNGNAGLFEGIPDGKEFYFVHSYHFVPKDRSHIIATTPYCGGFASVVGRENIIGTQFHPEKSQKAGFRLLKNFIEKY
ncbi:MAG: imidazole glycerol phosphate synthase subunit HisH [Endomicrobiales bacterium]|nr:imidazole glycerol phosphate synthase subunit HisH [Endomicrobiales bacterium]